MLSEETTWRVPGGATTLDGVLRGWAERTPHRPALRHSAEEWSYARLDDAVTRVAGALRAGGVSPGDRVVQVGHNSTAWVILYLAALRTGAIIAPANDRLNPSQFREQCELLGAAVVLHDAEHLPLVADLNGSVFSVKEAQAFVDAALRQPAKPVGEPPVSSDTALISFTSGTTGSPKGAMLSHEALLRGSAVFAEYVESTQDDSTTVLSPLFHNTGFVDQLGHMLVVGGCTNLLTRYRTAAAVAEFAERPTTFITAVPSVLRLLMVADGADHVFHNARTVLFGGSPMPEAWSTELRSRWPQLRLVHGYGLTEFTSACTLLPPELVAECGESVGFPAPGVRMRLVDEEERPVPVGVAGEVQVAGATRMLGYWSNPELTAAKLSGEWLRTGDLGHLDDRRLLWLDGRVDDVINRGGEKVLPAFVEACIAELPSVAESSVFGAPDPVLQYRVAAAVLLRPGHVFDEAAARAQLARRLPDYAVPERWVVREELPRTASGKVDRREVLRQFMSDVTAGSREEQ
ncbi:class I adenylate-forming enzyme family protein [Streptomyces cacaoi]|uniref:class I adenylate-forming enzyme family protein n=1 Tax=Streptomyces cacaoi TaxID=1898 RepID=UPI0037481424